MRASQRPARRSSSCPARSSPRRAATGSVGGVRPRRLHVDDPRLAHEDAPGSTRCRFLNPRSRFSAPPAADGIPRAGAALRPVEPRQLDVTLSNAALLELRRRCGNIRLLKAEGPVASAIDLVGPRHGRVRRTQTASSCRRHSPRGSPAASRRRSSPPSSSRVHAAATRGALSEARRLHQRILAGHRVREPCARLPARLQKARLAGRMGDRPRPRPGTRASPTRFGLAELEVLLRRRLTSPAGGCRGARPPPSSPSHGGGDRRDRRGAGPVGLAARSASDRAAEDGSRDPQLARCPIDEVDPNRSESALGVGAPGGDPPRPARTAARSPAPEGPKR